jgi:predicted secreted hydrolase
MLLLLTNSWAAEYQVALPGYHYQFPRDHFDHPDYQTEWWYYTGNLKSADGHRFGFELTFFRQGVARDANASPWRIHDLYMAHLALSDISGRRFYHAQRINRAGPGIAGIDEKSHLIWNGNWQVKLDDERHLLQAIDDTFELQLILKPAKPPVIHGHEGISQKAEGRGHASHYISFTRLQTSGSIKLKGATYQVEGASWMDHEFFTNSMNNDESGWDWLSLQFDDNTELMLYRLRHKDGSVDPYSSGTYIDARGRSLFLSSKDFTMSPEETVWTSSHTKSAYPVRWQISVPNLGLRAEITTPLEDQELRSTIGPSYWEGAIDVAGERNGNPLRGVGYLEMTGRGVSQESNPLP